MSDTIDKVVVPVKITAVVDITDAGYLGFSSTVQSHIDHAREESRYWKFFIKRGGGAPQEQIPVKVEVQAVSIVPKGN